MTKNRSIGLVLRGFALFCLLPAMSPAHALDGDHPDPRRGADVIERHASDTPGAGRDYFTLRGTMDNSRLAFTRAGAGRVAFLGGSITHGGGWREHTMAYLHERFPQTGFEFINAGVPSMGSTPGAFRLGRDILSRGPIDLLFVEAAVNDAINGRSPDEITRAVEGILRQARAASETTDIVMMHFADPDKLAAYGAGRTPEVIALHEAVAAHYGVSTLNLAREVSERIAAGQFSWEKDFLDLHPSPYGHRLYSASIRRLLASAWAGALPAKNARARPHAAPEGLLDPSSYTRASLRPVTDADELWGFTVRERLDPRAGGVGGAVREGFAGVDMLVGTRPGQRFSFDFTGRAVGLFVAAGPDAGVIEYRIGEQGGAFGEWQTLDLYTRWSGALHLPWAHVLAADLEADEHVLTVRIAPDRNPASLGHACRIVHLLVNE